MLHNEAPSPEGNQITNRAYRTILGGFSHDPIFVERGSPFQEPGTLSDAKDKAGRRERFNSRRKAALAI